MWDTILENLPSIIAVILSVAGGRFLSHQEGGDRREASAGEHDEIKAVLTQILKRLNAKESKEIRDLKKENEKLKQKLAEAEQTQLCGV